MKINGADPDFHRRDLFEAIAKGDFPEWEFGVQAFDQAQAVRFDFDVLDPTKIIPEEVVPIEVVGRMVLVRNPVNFFAETEQAAFHPGHIVPGIDFTNDPLLQGRLFSYTDTQISRLGGANFHELPINRPKCPMRNLQRDGMRRMDVAPGRVSYEPNSLDPAGPREDPARGFRTFAPQEGEGETGQKLRIRPESFADHYSQARQFYRSMTAPEQRHIQHAFAFELSKVETAAIRQRMLGHLHLVDETLAEAVEAAMGMQGQAFPIEPYRSPVDLEPSPALSLVGKAKPTLKGRKLGVLVTNGVDRHTLDALRAAVESEGAQLVIVAPKIGGVAPKAGKHLEADMALSGAPSVVFDAVAILASDEGVRPLLKTAVAIDWIRDAFAHLKVIGHSHAAQALFARAAIADDLDDGVIELELGGGRATLRRGGKAATRLGSGAAPVGRQRMSALGPSAGLAKVVPISERGGPGRNRWRGAARDIADRAFENAGRYDADGAYPLDDVAASGIGPALSRFAARVRRRRASRSSAVRRAAPYRFRQPAAWAAV